MSYIRSLDKRWWWGEGIKQFVKFSLYNRTTSKVIVLLNDLVL